MRLSSAVSKWVCREGALFLAALIDDLKSILTSCIALLANMYLTHIVGCSITANHNNQVSYFKHRVVLTDAKGDDELVVYYGAELGQSILLSHSYFLVLKIIVLRRWSLPKLV